MSIFDASSIGGSSIDNVSSCAVDAQHAPGDYLTSGELPQLQYSRATIGQPPPPLYMFWGHAEGVDKAVLSQWFPSPFLYDGRQYSCAEQWMMAEKARLFGDEETRARIFQASKPDEMKGGSFRIFLCFELVVSIE